MELLINIGFAWIATISIFFLSIIYILRKLFKNNKEHFLYKINKKLRKHHKTTGILALIASLIHGFYSSSKILSINLGSIASLVILLLGFSYMFRKKLKRYFPIIHRQLTIVVIVLLVFHIIEVGGFVGINPLLNAFSEPTIIAENMIDLSNLDLIDGVYYGKADGYGPGLSTKVTVKNNKISDIEITEHHEVGENFYGFAMDDIPKKIIENQNIEVDAVSGATMTSYGIMNSVANALNCEMIPVEEVHTGGRGTGRRRNAKDGEEHDDEEHDNE